VVIRFLHRLRQLISKPFHIFHLSALCWTKPLKSSLLLVTLTDLTRCRRELVAENALLRQQLTMSWLLGASVQEVGIVFLLFSRSSLFTRILRMSMPLLIVREYHLLMHTTLYHGP
jgi:hypothetical protein